jgi:hypothetical protein
MSFDLTIGPYATQKDLEDGRKIIPYSSNKTASYVSNIFLGSGFKSPERNKDGSIKLEKGFCAKPVETISVNENYGDCDLCLVANWIQQDIQNHIEVRLQLFLIQIMFLFQSRIKVHKFRTQAQAGDKNKSGSVNTLKPTEAHAGTLPNLIANTEEEEKASYYTDEIELKPRVFAKHTSYYDQANITHKLPSFVNDVDSDIDFRKIELEHMCDTFREQSVNILNLVSTDPQMTPERAFRNFMVRLKTKIEKIFPGSPPHRQWVLSYYDEVVITYLKKNDDPAFIKSLMFDPTVAFPFIAHSLRQKMQYELLLLNKIAEIENACSSILNGTHFYKESIKCILTLGTDNGRLALLQSKTRGLTNIQEGYFKVGLQIPAIIEAAKRIIFNDPTLGWVDSFPNWEFFDRKNFNNLVCKEISISKQKKFKEVNLIALRILWNTAQENLPKNPKLAIFLCITTEQVLQIMKEHPTLARNVKDCLGQEDVKRLLSEFTLLLDG